MLDIELKYIKIDKNINKLTIKEVILLLKEINLVKDLINCTDNFYNE
jgi:hypothetical protein